jgi:hypothetical protein
VIVLREACILVNPDQFSKAVQHFHSADVADELAVDVETKGETHEETNRGFVDTLGDISAVRCCAG